MRLGGFDIDVERLMEELRERNCKRVLLQLPDGLKRFGVNLADDIERIGIEVLISTDPCFGACDVSGIYYMNRLKVDLVLQVGHLPIPSLDVPVLYMNVRGVFFENLEMVFDMLVGRKIGLAANAQHVHRIKEVSNLLRKRGYEPLVGRGDGRIYTEGLVLGCNFSSVTSISEEADSFLFIGSGLFHPIGISMVTSKPVIAFDPFMQKVMSEEIEKEKRKLLKKRFALISVAKDAEKFGVIIGIKPGQMRIDLAFNIKKKLERNGKKAYFFITDNLDPNQLKAFPWVDCLVSTICPRVAIDEAERFDKPILTPPELEILLGERKFEDYKLDAME